MTARPCLGCGRIVVGRSTRKGTRCDDCEAARPKRTVSYAEQQRRAQVVAEHRAEHGDWCPGWQREPHASSDLTADHVIPVGAGGDEGGPLTVLCRPCNSSKKDTLIGR